MFEDGFSGFEPSTLRAYAMRKHGKSVEGDVPQYLGLFLPPCRASRGGSAWTLNNLPCQDSLIFDLP